MDEDQNTGAVETSPDSNETPEVEENVVSDETVDTQPSSEADVEDKPSGAGSVDTPESKWENEKKSISGKIQALFNMFTQKLRLQYLGRILTRFSYASLTIYILQYLWVVILRFYELATGIQVLYTVESLLAIGIWMICATLFFVILSYYFEKYDYNYGFEGLDRKIQLWSKKAIQ